MQEFSREKKRNDEARRTNDESLLRSSFMSFFPPVCDSVILRLRYHLLSAAVF